MRQFWQRTRMGFKEGLDFYFNNCTLMPENPFYWGLGVLLLIGTSVVGNFWPLLIIPAIAALEYVVFPLVAGFIASINRILRGEVNSKYVQSIDTHLNALPVLEKRLNDADTDFKSYSKPKNSIQLMQAKLAYAPKPKTVKQKKMHGKKSPDTKTEDSSINKLMERSNFLEPSIGPSPRKHHRHHKKHDAIKHKTHHHKTRQPAESMDRPSI